MVKENWCYGCKKVLPEDVKVESDDHEGIPWHRVGESERRSDVVRIDGESVSVCGPVHSRKEQR